MGFLMWSATPYWLVDLPIDSLGPLQVFLANLPCIGQAAQPPPVFWTTMLPILMMGCTERSPERKHERCKLQRFIDYRGSYFFLHMLCADQHLK